MEIAYSLMENGDDAAFSQCTAPFEGRRGVLFSSSSASLGRSASAGMGPAYYSSLPSAASATDIPGTAALGTMAGEWTTTAGDGGGGAVAAADIAAGGFGDVGAPSAYVALFV